MRIAGIRKLIQAVFVGFLLLVVLENAGCSPKLGGDFVKLDNVPQGKALIYIYRPRGTVGFLYPIDIYVDDRLLVRLPHGSYYPYLVEPGEVELITKGWLLKGVDESITIQVKAGATYFLKMQFYFVDKTKDSKINATFVKMFKENAEEEIKECKIVLDESTVETKP